MFYIKSKLMNILINIFLSERLFTILPIDKMVKSRYDKNILIRIVINS